MYVELKPESDPETPLQDREPSTAEVPSPSSSDLSDSVCRIQGGVALFG